MLQDGLGVEPSKADLLDALSSGARVPSLDPAPLGNYYSSQLDKGGDRLAHIVEESSFFTKRLALASSRIYYTIFAVGTATAVALAWYWIREGVLSGGASPTILSQIFTNVLIFFGASSTLVAARSFGALAQAASTTFDRAGAMRQSPSDPDSVDLAKLLSGYDVGLAKAPPIPGTVYRLCRKRLDAAWKAVMMAEGAKP
ncbi:MAG: hypothetical protein NT062_24995 [Proteobacteria bacterium]|nr:hypothetical protein [Pseudomonadota bacterium]